MLATEALDLVLLVFWLGTWGLVAVIYAHTIGVSLFSIRAPERIRSHPPAKRFAVLIPAHNESSVLGDLLEDLRGQSYPEALADIHVIADNCMDGTAEVARSFPGVRVYTRSGTAMGKGDALRVALADIWDRTDGDPRRDYDAFVFFDADNRVSRDFLQIMNDELCEGHPFIQGYLGTKNPRDNWITRVVHLSYLMTNRLWQLGKSRAGLPSQCGGTGFCIDAGVLGDLGWPMSSQTEDLEMVCLLALRGTFPKWSHHAVVYDEKPTSVRVALHQRIRWMRGHFTNLFRFLGPLLRAGVTRRDPRLLDCALYLLYPLCALSIGAQSLMWLLSMTIAPGLFVLSPPFPMVLLILLVLVYYPILGILLETRSPRELVYLPLLMVFNWIWVAAATLALVTFWWDEWYHTRHGASLDDGLVL